MAQPLHPGSNRPRAPIAPHAAVGALLLLAATLVAPRGALAQTDTGESVSLPHGISDALVLPAGKLRFRFAPSFIGFDRRFGLRTEGGVEVGEEEPLGLAFTSDAAGADLFPQLSPFESLLGDLTGNEDFRLNIGATRTVMNGSAQFLPLALHVGILDRLQAGVRVPFVQRRMEVGFDLDTADANAGVAAPDSLGIFLVEFGLAVEQARDEVDAICGNMGEASAACRDGRDLLEEASSLFGRLDGTLGNVGIVPLRGSAAGDSLSAAVDAVRSELVALGVDVFTAPPPLAATPMDSAGFRTLITNPALGIGGAPLAGFDSGFELGDVEVDLKFQFVDGITGRRARPRPIPPPSPDTAALPGDTAGAGPDTATVAPDTAGAPPDTTGAPQDTVPGAEADTAAAPPDTATARPDTAAAPPDTATARPDTAAAPPDTAVAAPGDTAAARSGQESDEEEGSSLLAYRGAVGVAVRFGTGSLDLPSNFVDVGSGDGQTDIEIRSYNDLRIGRRVLLNLTLRYGVQRSAEISRRVAPPDAPIVGASRLRRVSWAPGNYLELEFSPKVLLTPTVSAGLQYSYLDKSEDEYDLAPGEDPVTDALGSPVPASVLGAESALTVQRLGVGFRYSSLAAVGAGRSGLPFEVDALYESTVDGQGGRALKPGRFLVSFRTYFDL